MHTHVWSDTITPDQDDLDLASDVHVEPELKRRLHAMVARQGRSLKDWLIEAAHAALHDFERDEAARSKEPKENK